jgi:hypothetical protein
MTEYIQLARIRGHVNLDDELMHKDDFYTLCCKNPKENIGLRKKYNKKQLHLPTFKSSDVTIDYLCSNFVRFCLSLYKNKCDLNASELIIIPKQAIPISKELKEYIEEFLPDFYGIRK